MITTLKQLYLFLKNIIDTLKPASFKVLFNNSRVKLKAYCKYLTYELPVMKKKLAHLGDTNFKLGLYHLYKANNDDAHFRFQVLKIFNKSNNAALHYNLGRCYIQKQKLKKARKHLQEALKIQEHYPEANYYLNKITKKDSINFVPQQIIQEKFDYISSYYVDMYIGQQKYRGYKIALHEILSYLNDRSRESNILEIGCGTGVCGHFLKVNHVGKSIIGVDISQEMLNIAAKCNVHNQDVYDSLFHMSDSQYFSEYNVTEKFDIVLAIDVLGSEKDLHNTLSNYKNALKKSGIIVAIVRALESDKHTVELSTRQDTFCYSQDYMLQLGKDLNMEPFKVSKCELYNDVTGYLSIFIKE